MHGYVLEFDEIDRTQTAMVGGKGAHLGELSRIEGVRVPAGFCVTTAAFHRVVAEATSLAGVTDRLSRLKAHDHDTITALAAEVRDTIEDAAMPRELATTIARACAGIGEHNPCAVRSSATAEDLPTASFAGQHDSFLNVCGTEAILRHVIRCWASLFTERAVTYRLRNGIDHRNVAMAVVVQRMVFPAASGLLFTADPVTGHRKIACVEAVYGLGEALVSGTVSADSYMVRGDDVVARTIATRRANIRASPSGGTAASVVDAELQDRPALTDAQVVQLAQVGRRIEAHFGRPQDIEWCLVNDAFQIVQSRPITTLFPIPTAPDGDNHVYVSVGHQQMMTDAMKPLGISVWQLTAGRPMHQAGGRLFVDITHGLAAPATRPALLDVLGRSDPFIRDALQTILERDDFLPRVPGGGVDAAAAGAPALIEADPAIVEALIARSQASLAELKREITTKKGSALLDFILADIQEMRQILFDPVSHQVITTAMEAAWWLNEQLHTWLGEKNAADTLTQSVPHNVTSEMGLALLDVADVIRPYPEVGAFLQQIDSDAFLDDMTSLAGGPEARTAICAWLDSYGMRCPGEIDITRPRWSERPSAVVPMILANVRDFEAGAGKRRFQQGRDEAARKTEELLERLRTLPEGEQKADETSRMIDRVRTFSGYREYPKYGLVRRYFVYRQCLLQEAERLVHADVLHRTQDIFYLTMQELHDVVRTEEVDHQLIRRRMDEFHWFRALTPPRVLTSEGESVNGKYRRDDVPPGALTGLPVSAGTIEGRARVVLNIADANLGAGDILVTPWTDPSWTPLFVAISGLVTEVGGRMTHGAVIAREYGLPAVVAVENATRLIRDGQRIRVNGTDGYIEILD